MAKTTKKVNHAETNTEEKIMTKYDRKMQRRREEALKEAKKKKVTLGVLIAILIAAVIGGSVWAFSSYNAIHKEYIKVNGDSVSGIEFDFYYGISKNENLSQTLYGTMTYADYYKSYLGYDTSKSDKSQEYSSSEGNSWYDYFANNTVSTIKQYKALIADAEKNGFTYDNFDADYEALQSDIQSAADEAGVSVKEQYKSVFGSHATESNLKSYIETYLKAEAYKEELQTKLAASDDEVQTYYEENKNTYDQVTYRQFTVKAETEGDATALAEAKTKADSFLEAVTDETTFAEQCRAYATGDDVETYASDDGSLKKDTYQSSVDTAASEWVFDSARVEGDQTVIEDLDNNQYIVLYYVSRMYDESNNETIASTLLNQSYSELISSYTDSMEVDNIHNRIKMLSE